MEKCIRIKGARVNNLKSIDLDIPLGKFVVITGLSGSGKSSLAFDTLYAEGQRRYVESLSSYARQFLGRMSKPECDYIKGIPPAIAIEQKVISRNPRSTVGTSTEIYEYLRMLFARVGKTYSPVSGSLVKKHTMEDVLEVVGLYGKGTPLLLLAPLQVAPERTVDVQLTMEMKQGYARVEVDGEMMRIEDLLACGVPEVTQIYLVVDRLKVDDSQEFISRLTDSVETAFYEGGGECLLRMMTTQTLHHFSTRFETDGIVFEEPTDNMFAFNSPAGACPECEGFGRVVGVDESLVVPDTSLSLYDGAVVCWRGEKMSEWKSAFITQAADYNFPIFEPYFNLTQEQKDLLWHGDRSVDEAQRICIDSFFKMLTDNQYKIQYRVMLARYRGKTVCPSCKGTRLKREAMYVKVGGRAIAELVNLPIYELQEFFATLQLDEHDRAVAKRILTEINNRMEFLVDVGLGYLTLNRQSNSLSGGESQRINLATSLGSSLVGSLYILDEPSIGLHSRDTERLINVLRRLQQLGNTVVVVEHDEDIIRAADYLIDIGPDAGRLGGEVMYHGIPPRMGEKVVGEKASYTLKYLTGEEEIIPPLSCRPWNNYIEVKGARENNLQGIDVKFPLNVMSVVTGVSGSGKSTLVRDILYRALKRNLDEVADRPGQFIGLTGDLKAIKAVEFVDQNPIGKSSRSNPVTYVKAYDEIRKIYSALPLAQQMGYTPSFFSFNIDGGRCEECKGDGVVTVEMQFMADLVLTCETCQGQRFKRDLLEVRYHEMNINDILNMTVNQAVDFFTLHGDKKVVKRLCPLQAVGLGYIKLGQTSNTLSGGENQRVKLAYYLGQEKIEPTMFIFDEPTTGLHFHDIKKLLESFAALIGRGHTILVIEHNIDVIKCADYVIDLGPDGGAKGGCLVATGTPKEVAACTNSYTGHFIAEKLS